MIQGNKLIDFETQHRQRRRKTLINCELYQERKYIPLWERQLVSYFLSHELTVLHFSLRIEIPCKV
jgi:hypothetical protein